MNRKAEETLRGSLWLCPEGDVGAQLQTLIRRLNGQLDRAAFAPHVTLLGGIELDARQLPQRLAQLAAQLKPFTVSLGRLQWRDEHFRSFYTVAQAPELDAAHAVAQKVFGRAPATPFEPHLSLLYGALDPRTKEQLARELGGELQLSFVADRLHWVNASAAVPVADWRVCASQAFDSG